MKYFIILMLILSSLISCAQEKTVEEIYQDCYFKAMPDNGKLLKDYHKQYEQILISNKVLASSSGESYDQLIKSVMKYGFVNTKTDFSFNDSIMKLSYGKIALINKTCLEKIRALPHYKSSMTYEMDQRLDSIATIELSDPDNSSRLLMAVFDAMDLEKAFFKIKVLHLIELINAMRAFDEPYYSEEQLENALHIYLTKEIEILIDDKHVTMEKLDESVQAYMLRKKTDALISLDASRDLKYSIYTEFIDKMELIFTKIKDDWAMTNYNKKYENLTEEHQALISQVYSFKLKLITGQNQMLQK